MTSHRIPLSRLKTEIEITTARSGGPGGQNVNKVETKVVIRFNVTDSTILTDKQKAIIKDKLSTKITKDDELIITAESSRSQLKNKELAFKKLDRMLTKAFARKKLRKATKPTKASKKKRLDSKKKQGEKKKWRQKPE